MLFHIFHVIIPEKVVGVRFRRDNPNPVTWLHKQILNFPSKSVISNLNWVQILRKVTFREATEFPSLFFGGLRPESTLIKRLMQAKKVTKWSGLRIDLCDRVKLPFSKYKGNSQYRY